MSLYTDTKMIRSVNCSGAQFISSIMFQISTSDCDVACHVKFSTRKPTGSPSIRCNSRYLEEPVNRSIFDFHASNVRPVREICQDKAPSQRRCELLLSTVGPVCRSNKVDRSHGHVHQSIVDIPLVCSCSEISFCDSSNKCFFCRLVSRVFPVEWKFSS